MRLPRTPRTKAIEANTAALRALRIEIDYMNDNAKDLHSVNAQRMAWALSKLVSDSLGHRGSVSRV